MARSRNRLIIAAALCLAGAAAVSGFSPPGAEPETPAEFIAVDIGDDTPLLIQRRQVTREDWRACAQAGACAALPADGAGPMTGVSYHDILAYLAWRSAEDGVSYRLPDFGEWMLAAADQAPPPVEPLFDDPALAWTDSFAPAKPADASGENRFGIEEMRDDIWEWTASCHESGSGGADDCRGARIAMGDHKAWLSELTRDASKTGCGGGRPLAHLGFRLVIAQS